MLKRLHVSHYKSLESVSLDFGKTNVIVGLNGAGKSNIIDVLSFFSEIVHDDLDSAIMKRHGVESIRQWSKFRPFDISLEVEIENSNGHGKYGFSLKSGRGAYYVSEEFGEWTANELIGLKDVKDTRAAFRRNKEGLVTFDIPDRFSIDEKSKTQVPSHDLFLTGLQTSSFNISMLLLRPIALELSNLISYSIYPNTLRQPRVVSRDSRLVADGSNLPSVIRRMTGVHKASRESVVESLATLLPHVRDIVVKSAGGYYVPVLEAIGTGGDSHQFNLSQVSDGTLRMLGLLTALYQPDRPSMIAIEEPEQMIHPGALPILAEAMEEFVSVRDGENNQLFITTHSPNLLDLFDPKDIIWTSFEGGVTRCGRVDKRQIDLIRGKLFTTGEVFVAEGFVSE